MTNRWLLLLCALLVVAGCTSSSASAPESRRISKREPRRGFHLSDADPAVPPARTTIRGDALGATETASLLARLPPLAPAPIASVSTALRASTPPPSRPGRVVTEAFPQPASQPVVETPTGPLRVVRKAPEGNVSHAPNVSVTFDRPMVALSTVQELTTTAPPISITPRPRGTFRWLGTQTLVFQPERELPKSTEYRVEIPRGTKSLSGATTDHDESFSITTPTVQLVAHAPESGPVGVRPLLFAELDQRVDPAEWITHVQVDLEDRPADGSGRTRPVRLATPAEIAADRAIRDRFETAERAHAGRSFVFVPVQPLPAASLVNVTLPRGLRSLEGSRLTETDQTFQFRTFDKLVLEEASCDPCTPTSTFSARFSTSIDPRSFDSRRVRIEPTPADLRARVRDGRIELWARWKSRTRYVVTFDESLTDQFGQHLLGGAVRDFMVVPFPPTLYGPPRLSVIEPSLGGSTYSVYSTNLVPMRLRLVRLRPEDWRAYLRFESEWFQAIRERKYALLPTPPGSVLVDRELGIASAPDQVVETAIDLKPALSDGVGHVLVLLQPQEWLDATERELSLSAWVQVTHLGLSSFEQPDGSLSLHASSLDRAAPLAGIALSLPEVGLSTVSDAQGHARLPGPIPSLAGGRTPLVIARRGTDSTFEPNLFGSTERQRSELRLHTFDDRELYKPGETVRIKGLLRRVGQVHGGDVTLAADLVGARVQWEATDAVGAEIAKGTTRTDDAGGVFVSFDLQKNVALGEATVTFTLDSRALAAGKQAPTQTLSLGSETFRVEEFRRPEFEVGADAEAGPHVVGGSAVASVEARYYSGGGLRAAETSWRVSRGAASFTPPNRARYIFGNHENEWRLERSSRRPGRSEYDPDASAAWKGRTDLSGTHRLRVDFDGTGEPYPMSLTLAAQVRDQNQQVLAAKTTMLVHPADLTVGLLLEKPFLQAGDPIPLDIVVSTLEGALVAGKRVHLRGHRTEGEEVQGEWVEREVDVAECDFVSRANPTPNACPLATKGSGRYYVSAEVTDDRGRISRTSLTFWALGAGHGREREANATRLELAFDKAEYAPGDHAELLLKAPFAPAEALLEIVGGAAPREERFTLRAASETHSVAILPDDAPGLHVRVTLLGMRPGHDEHGDVDPSAPPTPASAQATTSLSVSPKRHALQVVLTPARRFLRPGGESTIALDLTDASGSPVRAEATLFVVDESVLALTDYKLQSPLETFFQPVGQLANWRETRFYASSQRNAAQRSPFGSVDQFVHPALHGFDQGIGQGFGAGQGFGGGHGEGIGLGSIGTIGHGRLGGSHATSPISEEPLPVRPPEPVQPAIGLRRNFSALAFYEARVHTNAAGHAEVTVKMPDSASRFRVMAVASDGARAFGTGESTITVRQPITVRPSAPRFLNYGDHFELPVVVQNQSDEPLHVALAARSANATLDESSGRSFSVAAGDRVEFRLPAAAAMPGTASFDVAVSASEPGAEEYTDSIHVELPVWTPGTTEAFATYGSLGGEEGRGDDSVAQAIQIPAGIDPTWGGLDVSTSSTSLFALSDAVLAVTTYPFENNESLASRVLAIATLRDMLQALATAHLPSPGALNQTVARDLHTLAERQSSTGGFGFWDRDDAPHVGVHVALALATARQKGYAVAPETYDLSKAYLSRIEDYIPAWYGAEARHALRAYALFVLRRMKAPNPALAAELVRVAGVEKTPIETLAWLLPTLAEGSETHALAEEIFRHLQNRAVETARSAHFTTSYGDAGHLLLASEHRSDALVLLALLEIRPRDALVPKIVQGLLGARKRGHWQNTQEDAFVLLALDAYFRHYENVAPSFVARTWLGNGLASEHAFRGYGVDRVESFVPMTTMTSVGASSVIVQKQGPGRLYYRLGLRYAPSENHVPALEQGFAVSRRYESLTDGDDVRRDEQGTWHVKLGSVVRVRVEMVAPSERHHVALVDPLPAGFEAINSALHGTPPLVVDVGRPRENDWSSTWYEHENLRDERAEAFTTLLWAGAHSYEYTVRATTPGDFVVPPSKAEEMYAPETFGRSASDHVRIE